MAALNLAGKTSGYIKLKSPDVALNATVELPNKDGILATLDDVGSGGGNVDLTGYATEEWVNNQGYSTQSWVQEQNYATESYVNNFDFSQLSALPD